MSTPDVVVATDNPTIQQALTDYLKALGPNQVIFEKLIHHACMKTTTTYGEIAPLLGLPPTGNHMGSVIGHELWVIGEWCKSRGWPALTSVVVKANVGVPGPGFWTMMKQEGLSLSTQKARTNWFHSQVFAYFDRPAA